MIHVLHGDCLDLLRGMADNTVDAIVTDPPYGLTNTTPEKVADTIVRWVNGDRDYLPAARGFMGSAWDAFVPPVAVWDECLRVLKPGGHVLTFAAPRTQDLMTLGLRLAGFEIRDSIAGLSSMLVWCYGSGFPKSRNISGDPSFCQRVPGLCEAATEKATESASEVLLADMCREGEANTPHLASLHGLPVNLRTDDAVPGCAELDVQSGVRQPQPVLGEEGAAVTARSAHTRTVRDVRNGGTTQAEDSPSAAERVLHNLLPREGVRGDHREAPPRPDRKAGSEPVRAGQPCMERGRDVQAVEGQLYRPSVRPLPTGVFEHGPSRRLRDGAPAGDGKTDRPLSDATGVRESHQPRPAGQPARQPGVVSDERGSQAWRGWPVCGGCNKPRLPLGLGTALKPSHEPIVVARKPLAGTVAANVAAWGTGAINIAATRTGTEPQMPSKTGITRAARGEFLAVGETTYQPHNGGRWPSNLIISHAPTCGRHLRTLGDTHCRACNAELPTDAPCEKRCVDGCPVRELDQQSGPVGSNSTTSGSTKTGMFGTRVGGPTYDTRASGGASRFYPIFRYQPKAPSKERPKVNGVAHTTVKPLALMRWLIRLVTPPGGTVLDMFAGSGTTGEAAALEGFDCILIEREPTYLPLIAARLDRAGADHDCPDIADNPQDDEEPTA